jgi:hypothetical protein
MMRKITLSSALCLGLILAACGGGGSDGGSAAGGNSADLWESGAVTWGTGAAANGNGTGTGSTRPSGSAPNGSISVGDGTGTSGSGGSGAGSSGSGGAGSGSGGSGGAGAGGSGSSGSSGSSETPDSGNSGSTGSDTPSGGASADTGNTIPVVVSSAMRVLNYPLVSVTICKPGSSAQTSCSRIDNVLLDTGSFGLRLYASAIPRATLAALPIQTDSSSGSNVAACAAFGSGYTWGSLRNADVKLAGEVAASVPIQVMSDPAIVSRVPSPCVYHSPLNSPGALGANGILGVGVSRYDCGASCAGSTARSGYYYADTNPATAVVMPLVNQVTNPVSLFQVNNNGVIVDLPAIPSEGALAATGTVTFGIDTQANNLLAGAGATVLETDRYGNFTGSYDGAGAMPAFIDSGSNALIFEDSAIPQLSSTFYAPTSTLTRSVVLSSGSNGLAMTVNLDIGNASSLFASINYAFSNLGAFMAQTIDLGLPFFYGRRIYSGIAGMKSNGGGTGPYVAFVSR